VARDGEAHPRHRRAGQHGERQHDEQRRARTEGGAEEDLQERWMAGEGPNRIRRARGRRACEELENRLPEVTNSRWPMVAMKVVAAEWWRRARIRGRKASSAAFKGRGR
jgi:hypothetical protein